MGQIAEHSAEIDGSPVFWRSAGDLGDGAAPVLYVHGVPTSSTDWTPFLARTGGVAPDLPGFGRSGKRGDADYSMDALGAFVERFVEHLGLERVRLVVHDWGGIGLLWAQRHPERVERLVVMDAVPLLPGYRWHKVARVWRTRGLGELFMGSSSRWAIKQVTRESNATRGPMPDAWIDDTIATFDQGTQRAILRLYRSAPPDRLAAAGSRLGDLTCPSLVVWGERDPYIPPRFAQAYADALGGPAQTLLLPDAGHWPWLDRPDLVETIGAFLDGG